MLYKVAVVREWSGLIYLIAYLATDYSNCRSCFGIRGTISDQLDNSRGDSR